MALTHWTGPDGSFSFKSWADAVVVRAVSKTERPEQPWTVSGDAYRFSTEGMIFIMAPFSTCEAVSTQMNSLERVKAK